MSFLDSISKQPRLLADVLKNGYFTELLEALGCEQVSVIRDGDQYKVVSNSSLNSSHILLDKDETVAVIWEAVEESSSTDFQTALAETIFELVSAV